MKIVILKNNLKDGLNIISRAISENANLPVLKNILLKTFNNKIKLVATNLEIAITQLVSGKIIEEGGVTIPFSVLNGIVNNSDSERINLDVIGNNLIFKTDNYEATIQGLEEENFPIIPKIKNTENFIKINANIFKEGLIKVAGAAQFSEIRPEISGVLLDFQLSCLKMVATDSFRLAEKTIFDSDYKANFEKGFKIIITLKTAQELSRILNGGELEIFCDTNQILFKNNDMELISRLIEGNYPDYEQIIPKEIQTESIINKEQFLNSVKLVSNFTGKVNDIKIKFKDGEKVLEIFSSNSYFGENKYLVPAKIKGDGFQTSFNWRYLMDGLKNFDNNEEVIFGVNSDQKPAVIKSITDSSYFYILMPIRNS